MEQKLKKTKKNGNNVVIKIKQLIDFFLERILIVNIFAYFLIYFSIFFSIYFDVLCSILTCI